MSALAKAIAAINALKLAPADHLKVMTALAALVDVRPATREGSRPPKKEPAKPKVAMAGRKPERRKPGVPVGQKTEAAIAFLRSSLRDGPKTAAEINAAANRAGIEPNALGRARVRLGVLPRHLGNGIRGAEGIELTLPEHRVQP